MVEVQGSSGIQPRPLPLIPWCHHGWSGCWRRGCRGTAPSPWLAGWTPPVCCALQFPASPCISAACASRTDPATRYRMLKSSSPHVGSYQTVAMAIHEWVRRVTSRCRGETKSASNNTKFSVEIRIPICNINFETMKVVRYYFQCANKKREFCEMAVVLTQQPYLKSPSDLTLCDRDLFFSNILDRWFVSSFAWGNYTNVYHYKCKMSYLAQTNQYSSIHFCKQLFSSWTGWQDSYVKCQESTEICWESFYHVLLHILKLRYAFVHISYRLHLLLQYFFFNGNYWH